MAILFDIPRSSVVGYKQQDALAGPKALAQLWDGTLPAHDIALIQAESQSIRWRADGTDPTSGVGMILPANEVMAWCGDTSALRFIEAAAGAILNVTLLKL